ncbi:GNAT family N-acetyltransferase [Verrucomicrobiota bacterium]
MRSEPCEYSDLTTFDAYLASLSSPIDSFLEDHILESQFHRITDEGHEVGAFAIRNASLLTQFHMVGPSRRRGQEVFEDILTHHQPDAAFVPTCDEFFLSHALDRHADVKKQALFFVDGRESANPSPDPVQVEYRPAVLADVPTSRTISGTFLDDPERSIRKQEAHVGYLRGDMVAVGLIVRSQLWPTQASIGMFTHEAHRQQGIGTETILYLKQVCRDTGTVPLAGCGYGNRNSQLTLQAAGMVTVTRLLRITF